MKIIKSFYSEPIAAIYLRHLEEAGIHCFLSNTVTSGLVPFGDGGVNLHVKEEDEELALKIIAELDENARTKVEEDFSEASEEDIQYEKEIMEYEARMSQKLWKNSSFLLLIVFIIFVLLISFLMNSKGLYITF